VPGSRSVPHRRDICLIVKSIQPESHKLRIAGMKSLGWSVWIGSKA
jgi:hypothetical protein